MTSAQRRRGLTCDMVSLPSARLADLSELLEFVDAFCEQAGISAEDQFDLRLAVEEVCANVMMHGYANRAPGPLEVSFCSDGQQVAVTISDRASEFDPDLVPAPDLLLPAGDREPGGFGWHLVRSIMDGVHYRYDATHGNTVTLIKQLQPGEGAEGPGLEGVQESHGR